MQAEFPEYDFAGLRYHKEEDRFFVTYSSFIAPLVQAMQELDSRVQLLCDSSPRHHTRKHRPKTANA